MRLLDETPELLAETDRAATHLEALTSSHSVESAIAAVRDMLGMDIAYTSQIIDGMQHWRVVDGQTEVELGLGAGTVLPLEANYCQLVLDGLARETIPLASRITLVCDAFHAMTSDRPYRAAMSRADAQAEVVQGLGG